MDCYIGQDTGSAGQRTESGMARGNRFQIPSHEQSLYHETILQILFGLLSFEFSSVPKYLGPLETCSEGDHPSVL